MTLEEYKEQNSKNYAAAHEYWLGEMLSADHGIIEPWFYRECETDRFEFSGGPVMHTEFPDDSPSLDSIFFEINAEIL